MMLLHGWARSCFLQCWDFSAFQVSLSLWLAAEL
jgi:hypothetical protein